MKRRSFFGFVAALFGPAVVKGVPSPAEPSYTYDWSNRDKTDDPRFPAGLCRGDRTKHRLYLDGKEVDFAVVQAKTGPDGWIRYYEKNADGSLKLDESGYGMSFKTVHGRVRYEVGPCPR